MDVMEPRSEADIVPPPIGPNVAQLEDEQPPPSPVEPKVDAATEP